MKKATAPEYDQHPVAIALMPGGMDSNEFDAFCDDVQSRGILFPATLHEGKVLDGWHRYRAHRRTGQPISFITYEGNDPAGYIASVNVLRRKLSSLQRALVGARLHREYGMTQREACKKLGISNEVVNLVLRAIDSNNTKLIKRIEGESDFSRGMLKEELEEVGLLRAKPRPEPNVASIQNSVFNHGVADTDGSDAEEDEEEHDEIAELLAKPAKGLKSEQRKAKAPKASAAQLLADQFRALMLDEQETFIDMIWPLVKSIRNEEQPRKLKAVK